MHQWIRVLIVMSALVGVGACSEGEGSVARQIAGLAADDDGCKIAAGCKAVGGEEVASEQRTPDPWQTPPAEAIGPSEQIVVGTNDLENPRCHAAGSVAATVADSVARYVRGDTGAVCTALLITHDNKLIVPLACASATSVLGVAYFGTFPDNTRCRPQGATLAGDAYPAVVEQQFVNFLDELMIVQLGPRVSDGTFATQNHSLIKFGPPSSWGVGAGVLLTDSLVYAGTQSAYTLVDPSCNRTDPPLFGGIGRTDCDSEGAAPGVSEFGFAGALVYGENGCVPSGPSGGCLPGTGPQSSGAIPGRLVGLMHRPSQASPVQDMKYLSLARLTSPTGFLTQSGVMTPGNFDP